MIVGSEIYEFVLLEDGMIDKQIKNLTLVALFTALVVIGSRIYVGTHDTFRFHLGNSMCLLAALMLNPSNAGLASGLGSLVFDMLFYPPSLGPIGYVVTFVTKFVMGFVASIVFKKTKNTVIAGAIGEIAYIILYALKTYIESRLVLTLTIDATIVRLLPKMGASVTNAVAAIVVSVLLYKMLKNIKL